MNIQQHTTMQLVFDGHLTKIKQQYLEPIIEVQLYMYLVGKIIVIYSCSSFHK
jgi:hypothetical protein